MQLWVGDNRKALGLTPADIAGLTGVTEDTARGWESRGSPSQDAVAILERRFGKPAPESSSGEQDVLVEALRAQTAAIKDLVDRLDALTSETSGGLRDLAEAIGELIGARPEPTPSESAGGGAPPDRLVRSR